MRLFIVAWQVLTVVPLKKSMKPAGRELGSSMGLFPLVGLVLGGALVLLDHILQGLLPLEIRSIAIIAFLAIITGAQHLDGLADTVDGIMGGRTRSEVLRIMRDSRIGSEGAVALILLVLTKYLCISSLHGAWRDACLITMPAVGRWTMVLMAYMGPYARTSGLGKAFVENMSFSALIAATLTVLASTGYFMGLKDLIIFTAVGGYSLFATLYFRRRLGGVTGDTMGALNETSELLFLIGSLGLR